MADGFGVGGFGIVEPFGSVEGPAAPPVPVSDTPIDQLGIFEATAGAIGESDNTIGGLFMTRTTAAIAAAATTFPVETTLGWTSSGKIALDGIVYYYTGTTATGFTGITHIAGGSEVAGAKIQHRVDSTVTDLNRDRTAIDLARRAMLVDYAEGEDLSALGRNLGVNKLPVFSDDDQYREVIKALAYNPKGTILGLELALDALVGSGNYEIYEDLIQYPNVVFIKVDSSLAISASSAGKAYLTAQEFIPTSGSFDTLVLSAEPLAISSVQLCNLDTVFDFRYNRPSALMYSYHPGEMDPVVPSVSLLDGGMEATGVSNWTPENSATLTKSSTDPQSGVRNLRVTYNGVAAPSASQACLDVGQKYRLTGWYRGDGGPVSPAIRDGGITVLAQGTSSTVWQYFDVYFTAATTELWLYGVIASANYVEFDSLTLTPLDATYDTGWTYAGSQAESTGVTVVPGSHCHFLTTAPGNAYYSMLDSQGARITDQSYVEISVPLMIPSASVLTSDKEQASISIYDGAYRVGVGIDSSRYIGFFVTPGAAFTGDVALLSVDTWYNITIKKYADNYAELWIDDQLISTRDYSVFTSASAGHRIDVGIKGTASTGMRLNVKQAGVVVDTPTDYWAIRESGTADVLTSAPDRVVLNGSSHTLVAGDAEKDIRITGSTVTNAYGGNNNGFWQIDTYVSGTTVDLVGRVKTGVVLDAANPTRITIDGDYEAFTYPDDLGREIVISGSAGSNDGTYIIDTLLEPETLDDLDGFATSIRTQTNVCEVVAATFTSEIELSYKLNPTFTDESGLDWELSDAGSYVSDTITLREALWANDLYTRIKLSNVLTGQILESDSDNAVIQTTPSVLYEYYPLYISDILGTIRDYLDALTAAGVIPQYIIV